MYSKHHFLVSAAAGLAIAISVPSSYPAWAVVAYAAAIGVGIDFDHFLVSRINTGDWSALETCLRTPTLVFLDQDAIFEEGEIGELRRLLSHAVAIGLVVPLTWIADPFVGGLTAAVLYLHVLADLVWDVWRNPRPCGEGGPTEG